MAAARLGGAASGGGAGAGGAAGSGRGRGRARARARPALLPSLLASLLALLSAARRARAQGFARTDDAAGAPPAPFEYQQDPFTRSSEYPYNVCNQLPGNIGEDAASYAETYKRAKCVPIEAGELEFCDAVAYDSCVRIQEYWRFDNLVAMQYDAVLQEWKDTLTANDQAALVDPGCDAAFKAYFCYAAFPKCWEGDIEGEYWELPLCFDYCVAANAACIGNPEAAKRVCRSQVGTGRVSPEGRTDIICMSCASGLVAKLRAHALLAALFAAAASAMLPP